MGEEPRVGEWYMYKGGIYRVLEIQDTLSQDHEGNWVKTVKYDSPNSKHDFYRPITQFVQRFVPSPQGGNQP